MRRSPLKRKAPIRPRKPRARRKTPAEALAFPKPQKAKRAKLRAGRVPQNPAYLGWIRTQPCVGLDDWPSNEIDAYGVQGHYCFGPTDPSHERDHTGWGLKEPDETCVPMCRALHNQWEDHAGRFAGWSNEDRHRFMAEHRITLNARFELETGTQLEWRP